MPENNHEVIIAGFVFPDTVTVTLVNDEHINSRDYVSKELYESICAANDAWREQNAKLRELVQDYHTFLALAELAQPIGHIVAAHGHPTLSIAALDERYRELGVEVDG